MRETLRSPAGLVEAGLLAPALAPALEAVAARYAIAVPPAMRDLIDTDDPNDPIARQIVPSVAEAKTTPGERADPIGDAAHSPVPGIVHRYPDRALLKLLHVCPVYCRFCFRREVVGPGVDAILPAEAVEVALDYIAGTPAIWEVILTGGDPLMLSPRRIGTVMDRLAAMPHVKVVRFHSRVPVADPARITEALVGAMRRFPRALYVALHANHPRELSAIAIEACDRLMAAGMAMVSQTVLLRGVNDDVGTLTALMRAFVEARIKPYYLHHGDLAPGTSHFRVGIEEGRALVAALHGQLSGLCQPTYVIDLPGGYGKVPAAATALVPRHDGRFDIADFRGVGHVYPPDAVRCGE